MKFISLVVLEQLNIPNALGPTDFARTKPSAARESASSHDAVRSRPPSLTSGWVRRTLLSSIAAAQYSLACLLKDAVPWPGYVLRANQRRAGAPPVRARFARGLRSPVSRQLPEDLQDDARRTRRSRRRRGLHAGRVRIRVSSLGPLAPRCAGRSMAAPNLDQRRGVVPAQRAPANHPGDAAALRCACRGPRPRPAGVGPRPGGRSAPPPSEVEGRNRPAPLPRLQQPRDSRGDRRFGADREQEAPFRRPEDANSVGAPLHRVPT